MIKYNRNIFSKIDSEDKAYWLGFITADGYIHKSKHMLRIKIGEKDKEHLIKFINFIDGDISMLKYEIHSITGNKNYYVSLYSKEIVSDLYKLGIFQAKSGKEQIPNIQNKYMISFIRGLWDGDGFIRQNLSGIGLVGSYDILSFVQKFLNKKVNSKILRIYPHCNIYKIEYRNNADIKNILSFLYENSSAYLNRKYYLFCNLKDMLD